MRVLFTASGLALLVASVTVSSIVARADDTALAEKKSQVEVNVRVVRAENAGEGQEFHLDSRLSDLQPKLEQLPFKHFSFLAAEKVRIPIKKKQTVTLASGQTLTLRPVYCEEQKIGLWLRWSEKNGDEILDTRLHVNPGESMLAGTDSSPSTGLILAIDVEPVTPQ